MQRRQNPLISVASPLTSHPREVWFSVKQDGELSRATKYGEKGHTATVLQPEAQPRWLGTLPRKVSVREENHTRKKTGNPTRSRMTAQPAQQITHYQGQSYRSRELSQSLFGTG